MIKRAAFVAIWAVVCFVLGIASATAQTHKRVHLYVGGGLSIAASDLGSAYETGFHGMFGTSIRATSGLHFMPRLEFNAYKIDGSYWLHHYQTLDPALDTVEGGTLVTLLAGVDAQVYPLSGDRSIRPFLTAGGGWANLSNADFQLSWAFRTVPKGIDSRNAAYWNVGSGVEFGRSTSITFFVQLRYVNISKDSFGYNSVPLTVGLRF